MRRVFKDDALQARYEEYGYVIVRALEPGDVADLLSRYSRLPPVDDAGFFTQFHVDASHKEYRQKTNAALAETGDRLIANYLEDYRKFVTMYITKKPGRDSTVDPHRDWSFVDERAYSSVAVWAPLIDTNHCNGALYVLRGSHKLGFSIRGAQPFPEDLAQILELTGYENFDYLPIKAGEAIFYDHRLIHLSPPNLSGQARVVAVMFAAPREAKTLLFTWNVASKHVEMYAPPPDFLMKYTVGQTMPPSGSKLLEEFDYVPTTLSELLTTWQSQRGTQRGTA